MANEGAVQNGMATADSNQGEPRRPGSKIAMEPNTKKPGIGKRIMAKLGIEPIMLLLAMKGALPPVICLAAYQSDGWARKYTTLGYLSAIMSLLAMAIQPRAKFLQSITTSILFTCLGAAVALLQIQCVVSARDATTSPTTSKATVSGSSGSKQAVAYNASASAVAGVFLFTTIYLSNSLRAYRPQMMLPIIQYSIFTIVASSYAPSFPNMVAGKAFVKRLLETFLTGFGIATAVNLFILPSTSRLLVGKQTAGLLKLMQASIGAQGAYMRSVSKSHQDKFGDGQTKATNGNIDHHTTPSEAIGGDVSAEAKAVKDLGVKIGALFGKIRLEIDFAKRELAYGKLRCDDYPQILVLLREILLPIFGMSTFLDIMQMSKEKKAVNRSMTDNSETIEAIRRLESDEWDEVIANSSEDWVKMRAAVSGGLQHVSYLLEFDQKPKTATTDVEKGDSAPAPGESTYAAYLAKEIQTFEHKRERVIQEWCETKGIGLPSVPWNDPSNKFSFQTSADQESHRHRVNQQQLYLILYTGHLAWSMSHAILDLVKFADSKQEDGTMKKRRMIVPAWHRLKEFLMHMFVKVDTDDVMFDGENAGPSIYVGDSLRQRKDPEHLPPSTFYQKATNMLRAIPHFLSSNESAFGLRAAVATLSIGILAFLEQTQAFYLRQRVMWALIMIAISMSAHAGQGIFGFVARICGTTLAMCASMVLWYMGGQKTAAILPLFYIYACFGILFLIKKPELAIVAIISIVTVVLIIGYELQERKIGLKAATSNGQPYYKIYVLAPYRLACVVAGLAVNFFWTYFPYPVTTHSTLRKDLGVTLYLLANYYSCVHTTVECRLRLGSLADPDDAKAPMTRLDEARNKVFGKCFTMLNRLNEHRNFVKFEPTFGGKFPTQAYDELIASMNRLFNYMTLISYSSRTFASETDAEESGWLKDFRHFTSELNITSHALTSTLCLVSASMRDAQPLPPYLRVPKPYALADKLQSIDPELLSIRHIAEPCYAAFAVLEIASSLATEALSNIVKKAQELVGEVDFSFHVISTNTDGSSTSSTLWDGKEEKRE